MDFYFFWWAHETHCLSLPTLICSAIDIPYEHLIRRHFHLIYMLYLCIFSILLTKCILVQHVVFTAQSKDVHLSCIPHGFPCFDTARKGFDGASRMFQSLYSC